MWDPIFGEYVDKVAAFLLSFSLVAMFVVRPVNLILYGVRFAIKVYGHGIWKAITGNEGLLSGIIFLPVGLAAIGAVIYMLAPVCRHINSYLNLTEGQVVIVMLSIVTTPAVLLIYREHRKERHNSRVFARAQMQFSGSRAEIDSVFSRLRTYSFRLKYARWLYTHAEPFRDVLASTENRWPRGHRPNVDSDEGSILLAQLDEQWLGLDR